jgi:restriction system protein
VQSAQLSCSNRHVATSLRAVNDDIGKAIVASNQYYIEIGNDYLGKYRRVTGMTRREVELKAAEQLQRWSDQETRGRQREAAADAKSLASEMSERARGLLEEYRSVLAATLPVDDRLDWDSLVGARRFDRSKPRSAEAREKLDVPARRGVMERVRPKLKQRREELERLAETTHQVAVAEWEKQREAHEAEQAQRRVEVAEFRGFYEAGDRDAVERYVSLVLAGSALPEGLERNCTVAFDPEARMLVVQADVPALSGMPTVTEYRYVASRNAVDEKRLKDKEVADLYEQVLLQLALRTIHEVFEGDYAGHCDSVVFNGVVEDVDRATGKEFQACIISLQASREEFEAIDLGRVDPRACFRGLKGVSGSRLAQMQPVRPIRVLDTEDPRFIEANAVLEALEADQNLMTMEWQDFEVLVRDLFEAMFASRGAEVKVTRTSRDQGVDAVVFDPDPLMGGKTVIQAKRYRNAVPVAAVRELYGTMMNEGAGKGLLVTTSHFGGGALEFAKDKPLTLIDGANLLHLLQNHGHHVRIDLSEARDELLNDVASPAA